MDAQPYNLLSELDLRALCIWREAQGEGNMGKRGVGWVVQNRASQPSWWGHDAKSVILKPWQFSSFSPPDPNHNKWPADNDHAWQDCQHIANDIMNGRDSDITNGATHYHDASIGWPDSWGDIHNYFHSLDVGRLRFYKYLGPRSADVELNLQE